MENTGSGRDGLKEPGRGEAEHNSADYLIRTVKLFCLKLPEEFRKIIIEFR